ncbi:MAG: recombinase family protein [Pseudomonadota bacterium]
MKVFAYTRTSSAANVDGDSMPRQMASIAKLCAAQGYEIHRVFSDPAVSGGDQIEQRPGFSALLDALDANGVRTVIVEDASRFARTMQASILGEMLLKARGVTVLCSNGDNLFDHEDPMRKAMAQIATVFSELEKERTVRRLRDARDRKSTEKGKRIEGRKSLPQDAADAARKAYRNPVKGDRPSLRDVSARLAEQGYTTKAGKPYSAAQVKRLLQREGVYKG